MDPSGPFFSLKHGVLPVPNPSRLGLLVGLTDSSDNRSQAAILAPSLRINHSVALFGGVSLLGGAFSDSNHNTRQSLAFGASINIGQTVAPSSSSAKTPTVQPLTVSLANPNALAAADIGAGSSLTAIIFSGPADPAACVDQVTKYTATIQHDDGTIESQVFNFSKVLRVKDSVRDKLPYWIIYTKPGKILDVQVNVPARPGHPATGGLVSTGQYNLTEISAYNLAGRLSDSLVAVDKLDMLAGNSYRIDIKPAAPPATGGAPATTPKTPQ